jgi:hypothetical protein
MVNLEETTHTSDATSGVPGDDPGIELTILMPCLNEAETLETCIRKARAYLDGAGVNGEVLIADNGSTDGSQDIAEKAGARVTPIPQRGYGAALIGGIKAARGRFVIMGDADDSYDFSALDPFVVELRSGADLVMGNRFKGGIAKGAMPPLHRYLGNPVLSWIGQTFFRIPVSDFHCGLRGFSREAIHKLNLQSSGMEFASEMVVKAALNRLDMREVPTTLSPDGRSRAPHLKTWRDGWRHLRFLLLHSPKWLFAVPGAIMTALGVIGAGVLMAGPLDLHNGVKLDLHTLIASCFAIIIGVQLLMFSMVARHFASEMGILPDTSRFRDLFRALTLERLLQLSALLVVAGLGGSIFAFISWAESDFGDIVDQSAPRWFALSLTAFASGIQIAASAFLASFVRLRSAA